MPFSPRAVSLRNTADVYKRQAMQNELTLEENMELARKFVQEQFVAKGMIAAVSYTHLEKK